MDDPEDALRALADAAGDDNPQPSQPRSARPESPLSPDKPPASNRPESPLSTPDTAPDLDELAEASASAMAALSGSRSAAYDPAAASSSRRRRLTKPDEGMMMLRLGSVPVVGTVGLFMLALGVWGLMVRGGNTTLPMADRPNADQLAIIGLLGFPLGLCLLAGALFFFLQYRKDKRKLDAWEAAHSTDE